MQLEDLSSIKLKLLAVIFIKIIVITLIDHAKINMTLPVPKNFRAIISIIKYTC